MNQEEEEAPTADAPSEPPSVGQEETSSNENDALLNSNEQATGNNSHASLSRRVRIQRSLSLMASPLLDETGSPREVMFGLISLFLIGGCLGLVLPKNYSLPTPWYRSVSAAVGYIYFLCWSVSFYPQVIINFKRRSTEGLSVDFCGLNVLGFACYTVYNTMFFWSPTVQTLYRERHGPDAQITVQSNDVAFAIHAFVLASLTFIQIGYFGGFRAQRPSKIILCILLLLLAICVIYPCLIVASTGKTKTGELEFNDRNSTLPFFNWLDYLYLLSYIKILISLIKYVPQVVLNYQRKSTLGWSIWNIILDFTGGVLSDLQLVLDCADLKDFSGITGNFAKFGLGFVSIIFDIIFMLQHYVIYPEGRYGALEPLLSSVTVDDQLVENLTA